VSDGQVQPFQRFPIIIKNEARVKSRTVAPLPAHDAERQPMVPGGHPMAENDKPKLNG
jgi:hypothetical protein